MSFAENSLIPGETIVYEGKLHWSVMLLPAIFGGFLALIALPALFTSTGTGMVFLILAVICVGYGVMKVKSTEMAVTNKRVLLKKGILHSTTVEVLLNKIEGIIVNEPMLGKMLGYGTIVIRGTGGTNEPFANVANPLEFKRRVQTIIDSQGMAAGAR